MIDEQRVMRAAWATLLVNKMDTLPVDVKQICINMGIELEPVAKLVLPHEPDKQYKDRIKSSFAYHKKGNQKAIQYLPQPTDGLENFILGHELGHFLFGQVPLYGIQMRLSKSEVEAHEKMATLFSCHLIAPCILLRKLDITSLADIQMIFDVPEYAAYQCVAQLRKHYETPNGHLRSTGLSPLELLLYHRFEKRYNSIPGR